MNIRRHISMALAIGLAFTVAWIVSAQGSVLSVSHPPDVREVPASGQYSGLEQTLQPARSLGSSAKISVTSAYTSFLPICAANWNDAPPFGYGVEVHPYGDAASNSDHLQTLGMEWVKLRMLWSTLEPERGRYEWGPADDLVAAYRSAGVKILWSVTDAPAWSRTGQDLGVGGPPNDPQDLARFLGALAGRYCDTGVTAIQVWNEQNVRYAWGNKEISPAAYVYLLKPAYASIRQSCPNMVVVSGALVPTGAPPPMAMDDFSYLEGMYQSGLKDYCDAVGAQPAGFNVAPWVSGGQDACDFVTQQGSVFQGPCNTLHHSWSFFATLNGYYRIMRKYGDVGTRIWPTEFGWAVSEDARLAYQYARDNTYAEQADWTVHAFEWAKDSGWIGPMFLFNLDYGLVWAGGEPAYWSLLTTDGPVPAYDSIANIPK
jgi:hypothetical protein